MLLNTRAALCAVALLGLLSACGGGSPGVEPAATTTPTTPTPVTPTTRCAVVREVTDASELVPGPLARGRLGDFVIENAQMRAIIQKPKRNWFSIAAFGGNIIDASLKNADGTLAALDHYDEAVLGTNIESAPNYQTATIINAGGENPDGSCNSAIIEFEGPDDLLDFVNGSSAIRDLGFMFPNDADDIDLPLTIRTRYTLEVDQTHITMDSTMVNDTASAVGMYLVEYMNGSGEVEFFQHGYGFGEALLTSPCDSCRHAIYAGHEQGAGVTYGIIHEFPTTTSLSVSGVSILVYGTDAIQIALGAASQPFSVPANGETTFRRWFAVGDGSVSSVTDQSYALRGVPTGAVSGSVIDSNGPIAEAEVVVVLTDRNDNDFAPLGAGPAGVPRGPNVIAVTHFRTNAMGEFSGNLPAGNYTLMVNAPNRLTPTPASTAISVVVGQTTAVPVFTAPLPAEMVVNVTDNTGAAIAAAVSLIGTETSPDANEPLNAEAVAGGVLTLESGLFGDPAADPTGNGIILTEFAVAGAANSGTVTIGQTDVLQIEPGTYQLSVSHGPRFSEFTQTVTLTAGNRQVINATLVEVVPTPNHIAGDFHVHAFNSPDSEVTNRERVITYLAEDVDFFTPSDHGSRVDFTPVVNEMGVANQIATAPAAENTTFDYGHINTWPVRIEDNPASDIEPSQSPDPRTSLGGIDWGRAAPAGMDFPSQNSFGLTPAEIFAEAATDGVAGGTVIRQINHIETHLGVTGLQVDTGVTPPATGAGVAARKRLDPSLTDLYSPDHDSLELWIGADGEVALETHFIGENLGDWFNLISQDLWRTGVSNSDTHTRRLTGMHTRNMISVGSNLLTASAANHSAIQSNPHAVADLLKAGYSTMQGGPFLQIELENAAGQIADLQLNTAVASNQDFGPRGAPLPLADANEALSLRISVRAPEWAAYDRIRVFVNTPTERHVDMLGQPTTPARYGICPATVELDLGNAEFVRNRVVVATVGGFEHARFETDVTVPLSNLGQDSWIVVSVEGTNGVSVPMWPVVPWDFTDGGDGLTTRSALDRGNRAFTMANPLFVDADGGGWTPPGVTISQGCSGGSGPLSGPVIPSGF